MLHTAGWYLTWSLVEAAAAAALPRYTYTLLGLRLSRVVMRQ